MQVTSRIKRILSPELLRLIAALCDTRRMKNAVKMFKLANLLYTYQVDFEFLGGATNRLVLLIDGYAIKFAIDEQGFRDNMIEYSLSPELQPFVTKAYETNGYILVQEYVEVIKDEVKFQAYKSEILKILDILCTDYLLGDVGFITLNMTNWGIRDGKPVIVDYAYCHRFTEGLFTCSKCGASLRYDSTYDKLLCSDRSACKAVYTYTERKRIQGKEVDEQMIAERTGESIVMEAGVTEKEIQTLDDTLVGSDVFVINNRYDEYRYDKLVKEKTMEYMEYKENYEYNEDDRMEALIRLARNNNDTDARLILYSSNKKESGPKIPKPKYTENYYEETAPYPTVFIPCNTNEDDVDEDDTEEPVGLSLDELVARARLVNNEDYADEDGADEEEQVSVDESVKEQVESMYTSKDSVTEEPEPEDDTDEEQQSITETKVFIKDKDMLQTFEGFFYRKEGETSYKEIIPAKNNLVGQKIFILIDSEDAPKYQVEEPVKPDEDTSNNDEKINDSLVYIDIVNASLKESVLKKAEGLPKDIVTRIDTMLKFIGECDEFDIYDIRKNFEDSVLDLVEKIQSIMQTSEEPETKPAESAEHSTDTKDASVEVSVESPDIKPAEPSESVEQITDSTDESISKDNSVKVSVEPEDDSDTSTAQPESPDIKPAEHSTNTEDASVEDSVKDNSVEVSVESDGNENTSTAQPEDSNTKNTFESEMVQSAAELVKDVDGDSDTKEVLDKLEENRVTADSFVQTNYGTMKDAIRSEVDRLKTLQAAGEPVITGSVSDAVNSVLASDSQHHQIKKEFQFDGVVTTDTKKSYMPVEHSTDTTEDYEKYSSSTSVTPVIKQSYTPVKEDTSFSDFDAVDKVKSEKEEELIDVEPTSSGVSESVIYVNGKKIHNNQTISV